MIPALKTALAVSALALAVTSCAPTVSSGAPEGLNWYVISQLNDFFNDIDDPTNRPTVVTQPPAGVVKAVDINGDGISDWLVQWPESTQFCGTGGCRTTLYLSHGQNLVRVFDRQALEPLEISVVDGEGRVAGNFHHTACRGTRETCRLVWRLDPAQRRLVPDVARSENAFAGRASEEPIDSIWGRPD